MSLMPTHTRLPSAATPTAKCSAPAERVASRHCSMLLGLGSALEGLTYSEGLLAATRAAKFRKQPKYVACGTT